MMKCRKIIVFILICVVLSGCQTLRKKFVRKKKYQKEEPVYVDFKVYTSTSKEVYIDYYLFTIGWIDELIKEFQGYPNSKRVRTAVDEVSMNLSHIRDVLNDDGKAQLEPLHNMFDTIQKHITPSMSSLQQSATAGKLQLLQLRFRKKFKYSNASQWIQ